MIRLLRKSKRICSFSSVALLLFAVLYPCLCFAHTSSPAAQEKQSQNQQSSEQQSNDHSCCHENESKPSKDKETCDGCSQFTGISTPSYDLLLKTVHGQANYLDTYPEVDLFLASLANLESDGDLRSQYVGPPYFKTTNSSSLAKLFHRWLV